MPSIVPLLLALALVIAAAKLGGWLANRTGQPAVLGELIVGLLLGPSVFNIFGQPYFETAHTVDTLHELGELGVILLMFAAGLEIHLSDFAKTGRPALFAGVLGVIVPIGLGMAVALPFGYSSSQALFLGIVLAATSVSISAQTLMELGFLRSREGLILLGAAVVDDVLAIAVLSAYVAIETGGGGGLLGLTWIVARMLLFLAGAFLLGRWLLPRLALWAERLQVSQGLMSFAVVSVLIFAWASEAVGGVAAITGAFIVGVALSSSRVKDDLETGIHTLTYAFFVPIFLVGIGLRANARLLSADDLGLVVAVCVVAVLSKLIGAGAGARLGGTTWSEALRVGVGMVSRGEVGLIVAGVGVTAGVIEADVFTVVVIMVLVTTLATPPLLRLVFRGKEVSVARTRHVGT
ncbi:MAG: cation:proton antiporter [Anaerolineales bacterium]|nr:cation:proton antiporter [Anaerolineales bacterium]